MRLNKHCLRWMVTQCNVISRIYIIIIARILIYMHEARGTDSTETIGMKRCSCHIKNFSCVISRWIPGITRATSAAYDVSDVACYWMIKFGIVSYHSTRTTHTFHAFAHSETAGIVPLKLAHLWYESSAAFHCYLGCANERFSAIQRSRDSLGKDVFRRSHHSSWTKAFCLYFKICTFQNMRPVSFFYSWIEIKRTHYAQLFKWRTKYADARLI